MKFLRFEMEDEIKLGLLGKNETIHDLNSILAILKIPEIIKMRDFIEYYKNNELDLKGLFEKASKDKGKIQLKDVKLKSPILPQKMICLGLNYVDHAKETNKKIPKKPILFAKAVSSINDPNGFIELPSQFVDYEVELCVVIGKKCKKVSPEDASDYVFGYTILNDVTERRVQSSDGQFFRGKSYDTFAPIGPYIVTNIDPSNLGLELRLNGEIMQKSNTQNLIFSVPQIISFISEGITLSPGDLIGTGTPPGIGAARNPPIFLKSGDKIELSIDNIGNLINLVK
ncbi:MAG: FAA hydrolase family protein [Candidatus Lokiarchaeota archaeon]|nr:FAA hydrolase family protein [Candidatus Lokiarchaeota archaeon]